MKAPILLCVAFGLLALSVGACDRSASDTDAAPEESSSADATDASPMAADLIPPATEILRAEGVDGATLIFIPGGRHAFGGPNPALPEDALAPALVTLAPFWIDQDPVSAGQYDACIRAGDCAAPPEPEVYARLVCTWYNRLSHDRPMNCVSRSQAATYCEAQGRRLPSEWEWEAAARYLAPDALAPGQGAAEAAGSGGLPASDPSEPSAAEGRAAPAEARRPAGPEGGPFGEAGSRSGTRMDPEPEAEEGDWIEQLLRDASPAPPAGAPDFSLPPGAPPPLPLVGEALGDARKAGRSGWLGGVSEWTSGVFDGASNQRLGLRDGPRAPVRGRHHEMDPSHASPLVRWGEHPERAQRSIGFRCASDDPPVLCSDEEGCTQDPAALPDVPPPEGEEAPHRIEIPAGEVALFIPRHPLRQVERSLHSFEVDSFLIDRLPVRAIDFEGCIRAGRCPAPGSAQRIGAACSVGQVGLEAHPATCVTAQQAEAYCASVGGALPTELQWLRAAWGDGRARQPWGEEEGDIPRANRSRADLQGADPDGWFWTSPVGAFPEDRSPFGVLDVGGNVSEWVRGPVDPLLLPGGISDPADARRRIRALVEREGALPAHQVLGASWDHPPTMDGREYVIHARRDSIGFRCVQPAP